MAGLNMRRRNDRQSGQDAECPLAQPLVLPGCVTFELAAGPMTCPYQIFVSVPDEEPPPGGFPVIYVLDANSDFVLVTETLRRASRRPQATGLCAAIVVGIGYPSTADDHVERRYLDFTAAPPAGEPQDETLVYGGQAGFMTFLQTQLLPQIARHFPAHPDNRILLGHSLAGFFVLDMMAHCPELFTGYISFSPSIWWDKQGLVSRLQSRLTPAHLLRLYIGVGRYEQELAPWQASPDPDATHQALREQRRMVGNARDLIEHIAILLGDPIRVHFELGEQEDHATVMAALLCRALRFVQLRQS